MGAAFSSASASASAPTPPRTTLDDLPENCIAEVLSRLGPPQICSVARLSRTFHMASSADLVWESKLPSNYRFLVEKVLGERPQKLCKKEIYARLSQPNSFDGAHKKVWLEKSDAGVCFAVSWTALRITGIDDRRYWKHLPAQESRFHTMAYLQQIWWFEVDGELEFEFPAGTYSVFFRIQLGKTSRRFGRKVCHVEQVHGWDIKPVRFQLSTSDGQHALSQCYLHEPGSWVNYHAGDFMVEKPNTFMKVKFSMTQIDCTHTKGGLCLDSVLICPTQCGDRVKNF